MCVNLHRLWVRGWLMSHEKPVPFRSKGSGLFSSVMVVAPGSGMDCSMKPWYSCVWLLAYCMILLAPVLFRNSLSSSWMVLFPML